MKCYVCKHKATVMKSVPLCATCDQMVSLGIAYLHARDAFYMRMAFGEPELDELTPSGMWVVSGTRAIEGIQKVRARRDKAMWN